MIRSIRPLRRAARSVVLPAVLLGLAATPAAFVTVASASAAVAAEAKQEYKLDPTHTSVAFKISHNYVSETWGLFTEASGALVLDGDTGSLEVTVKAGSVNTANAKRDEHITGNDFFAAKQFPNITFKSTSFTKSADGYQVTGDLTLHGVTKQITLPVTVTEEKKGVAGNTVRGVNTTFTIKRSEYGIKTYLGPIGDEVTLFFSSEAAR